MFSFFKNKKSSPASSDESDPIPSAGSDFVMVGDQRQGADNPNPMPYPPGYPPLYPNFGNQFGNPSAMPYPPPLPTLPARPQLQHSDSMQHNNYLNGVPFKLSSEVSTGNTSEITKIQVDDILALITSKMEVAKQDYDFTLERSLLQQSEAESNEAEAGAEAEEAE